MPDPAGTATFLLPQAILREQHTSFLMHLLTLGLNHETAPVETREQLAFSPAAQSEVMQRLVGEYGVEEAAVLCTCNRSEIYAVSGDLHGLDGVRRYLSSEQDIDLVALSPCLYEFADADAAMHLFRVACGIYSLVTGRRGRLGSSSTRCSSAP